MEMEGGNGVKGDMDSRGQEWLKNKGKATSSWVQPWVHRQPGTEQLIDAL